MIDASFTYNSFMDVSFDSDADEITALPITEVWLKHLAKVVAKSRYRSIIYNELYLGQLRAPDQSRSEISL